MLTKNSKLLSLSTTLLPMKDWKMWILSYLLENLM